MKKITEDLIESYNGMVDLAYNEKDPMGIMEALKTSFKFYLEKLVEDTYKYVPFPESQIYMNEEWFDTEAVLDVNGDMGTSFLIPTKYLFGDTE